MKLVKLTFTNGSNMNRNPRVYCKDLPPIDLTPWKEHYSNEAYKASSSA